MKLSLMEWHLFKFLVPIILVLTIIAGLIVHDTEQPVNQDTVPATYPISVAEASTDTQLDLRIISAPKPSVNPAEAKMLAQLVWHEARYVSTQEQAAVMWCALNRVDSDDPMFPNTLYEVLTQPGQFTGYQPQYPVEPELYQLACDVLARHSLEQQGVKNVGRTLPPEYYWYHGDGEQNYFRSSFNNFTQPYNWSLDNPYATQAPAEDIIYL